MDLNGMAAQERRQALEQLIAQGDERAADVIGTALQESHWPVCDEFAGALAQIGGDAAKVQLLRALTARRHHIRSAAVKALSAFGGPDVRHAMQVLANDPSYEVREDVTEALAKLRSCEVSP